MDRPCSCQPDPIRFAVPEASRPHAPIETPVATACPRCFQVWAAAEDETTAAISIDGAPEALPPGEAGAIMLIALGLIVDSIALHREAILSLFEAVEDRGSDPWLVLERLDHRDSGVDFDRARRQLEQLTGR